MVEELYFSSIAGLARRLRRRELSSLELTRLFLDRLERLGPRFNALAELTRALAEAQARRADRALRRGAARSPLLGVPYGAKDLLATAGIPTRWGAPPYRDQVLDHDATVVQRLRAAGAVLTGKLAMVELAGGGGYASAAASLHGPGLNPWDVGRWSGGSSSGSGSAVAAGLVPFAIGSETWGSITSPSAMCGITGLRPTYGAVSRHGAMPLAWSMDKLGPMARSADDCAVVLGAIAGRDPRDATTREWRFVRDRRRAFRVGALESDLGGLPATARAFEDALRTLRGAGMRIKRVRLPDHDYGAIARAVLAAEAAAAHEDLIASSRLDELVDEAQRNGLREYARQPAVTYARALERRAIATRDVRALFREVDALVSPTLVAEAPTLDTDLRTGLRRGGHAVLGAIAGLPGLSVPMGFGEHGLPLAMQIQGDLFGDATILRIGALFQHETDWHVRRPPGAILDEG